MVRLPKVFKRLKKRVSINIGSETGLEEELDKPTWKLEERRRKKSFTVFGIKFTIRF